MKNKQGLWMFMVLIFSLLTACQGGNEPTSAEPPTTEDLSSSEPTLEEGDPSESDPSLADDTNGTGDSEEDIAERLPAPEEGVDVEHETENGSNHDEALTDDHIRYQIHPSTYMVEPVDREDTEMAVTEDDQNIALLTFDDGPKGDVTLRILDILDEYGAKAIFFVNGYSASDDIETLVEVHERGHTIGNHSWGHLNLTQEDPDTVRKEIISLNDFIEEQIGQRPQYFRPPFGAHSDAVYDVIQEEGMQSMNWSNGSLDWELTEADEIVDQVLANMSSGDNILFHDLEVTVDALDDILSELTEMEYQFVLPTEVILPGDQ